MSSATAEYKITDEGMSREEAYEGYTKMTAAEIMDAINASDSWDAIDEDMYRQMADELGLDFNAYADYESLTAAASEILSK